MASKNNGAQFRIPRMAMIKRHLGFNDCVIPGCTDPVTIHHIVPRNKGGDNRIENLLTICNKHHTLLHFGAVLRNNIKPVDRKPCGIDGCDADAFKKNKGVWRCSDHEAAYRRKRIMEKYGILNHEDQ